MAEQAWGKWGAEDERGALNHIEAEQVRHAAGLVRTGRVMSLAQPLSAATPVPGHRAPMLHFMGRDGGDYAAGGRRPGGFQFAEDTVVLPLHFGTHIDALCHAWYDDKLYNGFPSTGTRSTTGAARCGIDKMGPIVGRGVLLDMVAAAGRPLRARRAGYDGDAGAGGRTRARAHREGRRRADPHGLDRDQAREPRLLRR